MISALLAAVMLLPLPQGDYIVPQTTIFNRSRVARQAPTIDPIWDAVAECESNGRWDYNGSSGFDGGLQFHPRTWDAFRGSGDPAYAYMADKAQQIRVAESVLAAQGWGAWPACSKKLGLR